MNDVAEARSRIAAFGWDYLLIFGYLIVLVGVGLFLTTGPTRAEWTAFMSDPVRADIVAFLLTVLPITMYFTFSEASSGATWGKRRVGLVAATPLAAGVGLGIGRALLRNGLKFLPWQMSHTAIVHISGLATSPGGPPGWSVALQGIAWVLMAAYLVGLTRFAGHRPLYDRLAGTVVIRS